MGYPLFPNLAGSIHMSSDPEIYVACSAAEESLLLVLGGADGVPLIVQEHHSPGQAMRVLAPALDHAFARLGLSREDLRQRIAGLACVRGPGNFTGLRLSLSTLLGLAKALNAPVSGLDYLPLLAESCQLHFPRDLRPDIQRLWVATYARGGELYLQPFELGDQDGPPEQLAQPVVATLAEATEIMVASHLPCILLGSALRRNPKLLNMLPQGVTALPESWERPHPTALLRAAIRAEFGRCAVAPLYLRVSDAEENMEHIARKHGRDPEQMRKDFQELTEHPRID